MCACACVRVHARLPGPRGAWPERTRAGGLSERGEPGLVFGWVPGRRGQPGLRWKGAVKDVVGAWPERRGKGLGLFLGRAQAVPWRWESGLEWQGRI